MNYNKLNYFYTVAQTLNFTKAAEQLYISQPAISRHMKELEEDFGVPLFIRTNKDLILTDAGKVLYDEIKLFFSREQELYLKVRSAAFSDIKKLNIGFMGIAPAYHIPALINEMLLECPTLSINLRRYNWDDILPSLNCHEIDIALRLRMGPPENANYSCYVLDADMPAMVVSDRHPAAQKEIADLSDFKDDHLLMLSSKDSAIPNHYTKRLFTQSSFVPRQYAEYDQVETILMMIHADAGVALLSRFAATNQFSDLKVVPLQGMEPIYLELIWQTENKNPLINTFTEKMSTYWNTILA
mgnify:CR=1 FL=1